MAEDFFFKIQNRMSPRLGTVTEGIADQGVMGTKLSLFAAGLLQLDLQPADVGSKCRARRGASNAPSRARWGGVLSALAASPRGRNLKFFFFAEDAKPLRCRPLPT